MATLKLNKRIKGKVRGKAQNFMGDSFLLGTSPECEIQIPSEFIGETHAQILFVNGFYINDEKSLTGTYVNGVPVEGSRLLQVGDKLLLGEYLFTVESSSDDEMLLIQETHKKGHSPSSELEELPEDKKWRYSLIALCLLLGVILPLLAMPSLLSKEEFQSTGLLHKSHLNKQGAPLQCKECHSPFLGTTRQKCGACHQSHVKKDVHHKVDMACSDCHWDHQGRDAKITLPIKAEACQSCHPDAHKEVAPSLASQTLRHKTLVFPYPAFSHRDHLKGKLNCQDCHNFSPDTWEDFSSQDYKSCVSCHTHEKIKVPDHNKSKKSCFKCHVSLYSGKWKRTEESVERISSFRIEKTFHEAKGEKCSRCHVQEKVFLNVEIQGGRFPHEKHLSLSKGDPALCMSCHSPEGQGRMFRGGSAKVCLKCHKGKVTFERTRVTLNRSPFPHDPHLDFMKGTRKAQTPQEKKLQKKGCMACHVFGGEDEFFSLPERRLCQSCHQDHKNLGFKGCQNCHKGLSEIFKTRKPFTRSHPAMDRFTHKEPKHKKIECSRCHQAMEKVQNLLEVKVPSSSAPLCERCHLEIKNSDNTLTSIKQRLKNCLECHKYHEKKQ